MKLSTKLHVTILYVYKVDITVNKAEHCQDSSHCLHFVLVLDHQVKVKWNSFFHCNKFEVVMIFILKYIFKKWKKNEFSQWLFITWIIWNGHWNSIIFYIFLFHKAKPKPPNAEAATGTATKGTTTLAFTTKKNNPFKWLQHIN